ncbi:hypothetical protein [Paraburkholderia aromaticivorans]|uniref:hypothetical protein n=1 Tax=Paraburkholderia aromaticivorans TaxID=2026199 RepID=UPI001455F8A5|nr:hypothetical protein [Paraburkholderia aromaticivorans]
MSNDYFSRPTIFRETLQIARESKSDWFNVCEDHPARDIPLKNLRHFCSETGPGKRLSWCEIQDSEVVLPSAAGRPVLISAFQDGADDFVLSSFERKPD